MPSIPSVPSSWSGTQALTFAIPGSFVATSGTWQVTSTVASTTSSYADVFTTGGAHQATQSGSGNGAFNYSLALSSQQIADVNAAAGGNLSVSFAWSPLGPGTQSVTSCNLVLVGSSTPPVLGFPNPNWGYGFQAATPYLAVNLGTLEGGAGISNNGPNASPAALTTVFNFTAEGTWMTYEMIADITYAGQYISIAIDTSPDGSTWTNQETTTIGSNHSGVFVSESITHLFSSTYDSAYLRISFQEEPQVAALSLMTINSIVIDSSARVPIGFGSGYCNNTGDLSFTGVLKYGSVSFPGTPRENFPLTMFVKQCTNPNIQPPAHVCYPIFPPPIGYCQDGVITVQYTTTDCSGNYSFSTGGCVLEVAIALGTWVLNPNFSCPAPGLDCNISNLDWLNYIPDSQMQMWVEACGGTYTAFDGAGSGTAIGNLNFPPFEGAGGACPDGGEAGVSDGYPNWEIGGPCNFYGSPYACHTSDGGIYGATNGGLYSYIDGVATASNITGSYTLDLYSGFGGPDLYIYFIAAGLYYEVQGVYYTLTDSCGAVLENLPTPTDTGFDWTQFVTCTISNWTNDCSPPINTPFTGPSGGTLLVLPGTHVPRLSVQSKIYATYDGLIPTLCPQSTPVLGIEIQPPCAGNAEILIQADCYKDVVALSWLDSSNNLYSSVNRQSTQKVAGSFGGNLWEANDTVDTNASNIGMVYLPNETLYLSYDQGGTPTPTYRVNQLLGANGSWSSAYTPNPAVTFHSDSGRAQDQAFRFRALGSSTANGNIEFSQCRSNANTGLNSIEWTTPTVVTAYASGPYCGGIFAFEQYLCLFTPAVNVPGHVAAGLIYMTTSSDGGTTWSTPTLTGYGGYVGGITMTHQGVLVAVLWGQIGGGPYGATNIIYSNNGGQGWQQPGAALQGIVFPPEREYPCVITALGDNVFILWTENNVPQFITSQNCGGVTSWQ